MVQVSPSSILFHRRPKELAKFQRAFRRFACTRIPRFFNPAVLRNIQARLSEKEFYNRFDSGIAYESCMKKNDLFGFLHFLLNDEILFRFVEHLTGCGTIRCFLGRLYRMVPGESHYDTWHNDMDGKRMIGLSINLGSSSFRGGYLEIRDEIRKKIKRRIANTTPGDAVLFQVSDDLKHRVTPVRGRHPRIAFVGWFQHSPPFTSLLK